MITTSLARHLLTRSYIDLALLSATILYLEMVVIRWLAADIRVFAYFKNFPLLAAFLGLGLGCARADARFIRWSAPLLAVLAVTLAYASPLGLVKLHIPTLTDTMFWTSIPAGERWPTWALVLKFIIVILGGFYLTVALFWVLGAHIGALFNRLPPAHAYSVNLLASLAGIWAFAGISWLGWPPVGWLLLGCAGLLRFVWHRPWAVGVLGGAILLVAVAPAATRWSPYYRIDVSQLWVPDAHQQLAPAGYQLGVNHDTFQFAVDLSAEFRARHPNPLLEHWDTNARLLYDLVPGARVLVVGAGMGNDVAGVLRHGAQRVDVVEIDPAILALGQALHPEQPYQQPGVRLINDDARAVFARAEPEYDLIVFAYLDSHTMLTSMGNLRLDSYVYTLESLRQARSLLAPGGAMALLFSSVPSDLIWLNARLFQMVTATFGEEPIVIGRDPRERQTAQLAGYLDIAGTSALYMGQEESLWYVVGPGIAARAAEHPDLAERLVDPATLRTPVALATDDWPFLYLAERGIPLMPYGAMLAILVLTALVAVRRSLRATGRGLDIPMFFLGVGFMLLEVKGISQLALLFGSTWLVNALIISAILLLAFAANLFVIWRRPTRLLVIYGALALAVGLDYLIPLSALTGQAVGTRAVLGSLVPVLPLLFAGIIFATLFRRSSTPGQAFGSNLLGALVGGLLEYTAMLWGFKSLGLLALAMYGASWIALQTGSMWKHWWHVVQWPKSLRSRIP